MLGHGFVLHCIILGQAKLQVFLTGCKGAILAMQEKDQFHFSIALRSTAFEQTISQHH